MKIHYLSDLHLESIDDYYEVEEELLPLEDVKGDWVAVAGDLSTDTRVICEVLAHLSTKFRRVLYVLGNHEARGLDGSDVGVYVSYLEEVLSSFKNIHILHNREMVLDNIRVAGSTNWYTLVDNYDVAQWMTFSGDAEGGLVSPDAINARFNEDNLFLENVDDSVDLLITHFPPFQLPHNTYESETKMSSWVNASPKVWLCGHQHTVEDFMWSGTRFIANPVLTNEGTTPYRQKYIEIKGSTYE